MKFSFNPARGLLITAEHIKLDLTPDETRALSLYLNAELARERRRHLEIAEAEEPGCAR